MEWFKMYPAKFRAREFIGSDPVERATWLAVMCYCVEQENSGRLVGAALWKDRQWQQTCGVTLREVSKSTKLIKIEGDDVIIWEYPIETQDEIKSRRKASVIANGARWGKKSESVTDNNSYSVTESRVEKSREEKNTPPYPPASDLPKTLEEAISRGRAGGVSPDFCREVFLEHEGTSWTFAGSHGGNRTSSRGSSVSRAGQRSGRTISSQRESTRAQHIEGLSLACLPNRRQHGWTPSWRFDHSCPIPARI
jgi:hypothetical protein